MRHPRITSPIIMASFTAAAISVGVLTVRQVTKFFDGLPPPGTFQEGAGDPAAAGPPRTAMNPLIPLAPPPHSISEHVIAKNSTLARTLQNLGFLAPERATILSALKPWASPTRLIAGTQLKAYILNTEDNYPKRFDLHLDKNTIVRFSKQSSGNWTASNYEPPLERRIASYSGVVNGSLWNSAAGAGMDPQIISRLTEIFGWQVDFHREVQRGDRWRLTVERFYSEGKPVRLGEIIAAEYDNDGNINTAVLAPDEGQYYTPEGNSLRRMFLRSPLRFARITSGFNAHRFHPILHIAKPHLGIDYGAATGTPIMAVGAGTVAFAAYHGASGNTVTLRHNSVYSTHYKHLSRFAADVHPGSRVKMGQIIGYVGRTGLATGPHLHFELHANGRYVDPSGIRLPTADPLPAKQLASFKAVASKALSELPPWSAGMLTDARRASRDSDDEEKTQ
ncbi:MAG: peptidoglycan DD-metalloendopeptidase family protein [Proteobacteria bacterium]|nr:peptidoglycan DD-metalloendopeptidase family protein [Pseudomonadota bacterium]